MKKLLIIVAGIVAVIIAAIGLVFFLTAGMVDIADEFFTNVQTKNYEKAYSYLSEDFRANTSKAVFVAFLKKSALSKFKEASWSSRSISGGRGELAGSVTTKTGGVVPIKIVFINENDHWKIYSIHKQQAGLTTEDDAKKLPSKEELVVLVDNSMLMFAKSVNAKDFTILYNHIAYFWQKQISVAKLNKIFKPFMGINVDLVPVLKHNTPVFTGKPTLTEEGVLRIKGSYPTKPSRIWFDLGYIYEGLKWKLVKINVNIKPGE